jgi:hypothetical protein
MHVENKTTREKNFQIKGFWEVIRCNPFILLKMKTDPQLLIDKLINTSPLVPK